MRTAGLSVKRTLRRAQPVLSLRSVQGTNAQKFRALLAWLGVSERAAAGELGLSQTQLRRIKSGENIPEYDTQQRIQAMSRRWNLGEITPIDWPRKREEESEEPIVRTLTDTEKTELAKDPENFRPGNLSVLDKLKLKS